MIAGKFCFFTCYRVLSGYRLQKFAFVFANYLMSHRDHWISVIFHSYLRILELYVHYKAFDLGRYLLMIKFNSFFFLFLNLWEYQCSFFPGGPSTRSASLCTRWSARKDTTPERWGSESEIISLLNLALRGRPSFPSSQELAAKQNHVGKCSRY